MFIIALPTIHCSDKPILLWEPPDKQVKPLLVLWWAQEGLPLKPKRKQDLSPEWKEYWGLSFEANKRWAKAKLITLPNDFIMRWQRAFANWLTANHGYVEQEVEYLETKDAQPLN